MFILTETDIDITNSMINITDLSCALAVLMVSSQKNQSGSDHYESITRQLGLKGTEITIV